MGHAKIVGQILRWIEEYGLPKERGVCENCAWFSWDYPKFVCLKWDIDTRPDEFCKKGGFLRRSSIEDKKVVLIGYWDEEFNLITKLRNKTNNKPEDYGYVLDLRKYKGQLLAQIIGEKYFTLLEVAIKEGKSSSIGERVYIGKGERDVVSKVKRKISYNDLTDDAKSRVPKIVGSIIENNADRFRKFFFKPFLYGHGQPILSLALLAHVNEDMMRILIKLISEEQSPVLPNHFITMSIKNRVICELKGQTKHILFINLRGANTKPVSKPNLDEIIRKLSRQLKKKNAKRY